MDNEQLPLLDAGYRPWQLDAVTREIGRRGVSEARRALRQARAPHPPAAETGRRASADQAA